MSNFRLPTEVTIGRGARKGLAESVRRLGCGKPFLVIDPGIVELEIVAGLCRGLRAEFADLALFSDFAANPRVASVDAARKKIRNAGSDFVIGLGGGSAMDLAKAAAMLATNEGPVTRFIGANKFEKPPLPTAMLPTTCGTGSEVTWVSVLTDPKSGTKISVKGEGMFPNLAIVDADLIDTLPPKIVAWTGMDALTHAIEAFISNRHNPASDALAAEASRLLFRHLPDAHNGDPRAREHAMTAATLAGMAFGNSDVGAVHCLSESLGAQFDMAHGLLNAALLVPVLSYQSDAAADRLGALAARIWPRDERELLTELDALSIALDIPGFASLDIPEADFAKTARMAEENGSNASNPMPMTATDYREILHAAASSHAAGGA